MKTTIHFICTGNIYRSRLAQAYLRSKHLHDIVVTSSGTHAAAQHKGSITWYGLRLLYRYNLLSYMTPSWTETTSKLITNAGIVIFIGKSNYEFCKKQFPTPKKYETWDLSDFDDKDQNGKPLNIAREIDFIKTSEKTFFVIRENIDNLILRYKLH